MSRFIKTKPFRYLIYAIVSVVFILIYSPATSPLTEFYGADSAFFIMVGRGIKEGLLPYRDFFDMKGPYFFLIEYIGQLIYTGRTGAFVIQCINLLISLCIIDNICIAESKIDTKASFSNSIRLFFTGIFPCLLFLTFTFERGNLTEEFSLPILLIALNFILKYLRKSKESNNHKHPLKYGLFYGLSFGFFALYRINNAALIGAILLTVTVILLSKKEFINLINNALMFILGTLIAFIPAIVFFYKNGLLSEMLNQVFVFGFKYSSQTTFAEKMLSTIVNQWSLILLMLLPIIGLIIVRNKDWRYWLFHIVSFVVLIVAVSMGNGYLHYFTLAVPNLIAGLTLVLDEICHKNLSSLKHKLLITVSTVLIILQLPNFVYASGACVYRCLGLGEDKTNYALISEIKEQIPQEDYNSVYVYGLSSCSSFYEAAQLLPSNKYCDWMDHYMELVPQIETELTDWLAGDAPKWLVVSNENDIRNNNIEKIIEENFEVYTQNSKYILYKKVI